MSVGTMEPRSRHAEENGKRSTSDHGFSLPSGSPLQWCLLSSFLPAWVSESSELSAHEYFNQKTAASPYGLSAAQFYSYIRQVLCKRYVL